VVHVWGFSAPRGPLFRLGHIGDALSTLAAGVTLFFTLSGFLLYLPFATAIARGSPLPSIAAYFRNRVLRIAPAYWVILFVVSLVVAAVSARDARGVLGLGRLTDPFALSQTALLVQQYHPKTIMIGIGPAWSLAVEVVFYFVLPLLALGAALIARRSEDRRHRIRVLLGPPLLMLLIGLSGKFVSAFVVPGGPRAGYGPNWHSVIERSFWTQADLFSFGMLVAVAYVEVRDHRLALPPNWRRFAVALGLLVFLPCAWTMHRAEHSYRLQNTGEALAIALVFAAIVIPRSVPATPLRAVRLLESRVFVAVGRMSRPLLKFGGGPGSCHATFAVSHAGVTAGM
jgi:peptidoglycan/LPS O-acetylase OafA/YrhL